MTGTIRVGIGGWNFEPWRGVFYPEGLTQKRELEFASRALATIEINGTYYSSFKPASWQKWRQPTADFTYARLMATDEKLEGGVTAAELTRLAKQAKGWAQRGDVFAYFISGAKVRNPAAAQALAKKIG